MTFIDEANNYKSISRRAYLITHFTWTPIFEWCVVRCDSKSIYQKDICLQEIGLHAQNMIIVLGSIFDRLCKGLHDHLTSERIFNLIMNRIFI